MLKSFNVVDNFDEEEDSFEDYYFKISKNLDDIYSCLHGILPDSFSNKLLVLDHTDVLNKNGALDLKKLYAVRQKENNDYYSNEIYGTSLSDRFLNKIKAKSSDDLATRIVKFIKSEANKYCRNEVERENKNFCEYFIDAVEALENKLCDISSVSIDDFANRLHFALRANRDILLREHAGLFGLRYSDGCAYCDVAKVFDSETNKNYHVLIVDFDSKLTSNNLSKKEFDGYVMDKVYKTAKPIDLSDVPSEKRLSYLRPYGSYILLGEEGGKFNPFSLMPVKFEGRTLISNFHDLSPRLYGENLIDTIFSKMEIVRMGALRDKNYDEAIEISKAIMERLDGYYEVEDTICNMFNFNDNNWKAIKKIVVPNKVQAYIESLCPAESVKRSKNEKVENCIEKIKNQNRLSMGRAIEYANSKKKSIEDLRVRTASPFEEY